MWEKKKKIGFLWENLGLLRKWGSGGKEKSAERRERR